ncbi:MAG: protein kinase domain-containing protein, partial [Planctomycetota bacterium]
MSEPVRSIADFLAIVRKSGLVEESRLAEAVAAWTDLTADLPDELPQALIDAELLTHWQVDQLRKGKHKGFMLGKYKLLRLLGAGGMSSVYLAEHTTLRNKVAIKVLPVKRVDQTSYLERFEREARASARLNHPNIARAFD